MTLSLADIGLTPKSRKVKHWKITEEGWAILEREADLIAQCTSHKEIANKLGVSASYVSQVLSRLVMERRGKVPRLTHRFALDESVERLVAKLRAPVTAGSKSE